MAKQRRRRRSRAKNVYVRMWQERLLKIWNILLIAGIVVPLLYAAGALHERLYQSDVFILKDIKISGEKRLSTQDVAKVLQIPVGTRTLDVDLLELSERLLHHPFIQDAVIHRELPDTLHVQVKERDPFLFVKYQKKFYEIDINGIVLQELEVQETPVLPVIQGIRYLKEGFVLGQEVSSHRVQRAIEVMKIVLMSGMAEVLSIQSIDVSNIKQIIIVTNDNIKILLGGRNFEERLKNLLVLVRERRKDVETASYIDLRFGDVIVRPSRV